ncbi:MAG: response regulator [bacterium]
MKVLIIEDDPLLSEMVALRLQKDGYEVSSSFNGKEGLVKAKEVIPHIILLDLNMPIMNGFEVLEKLKQDSEMKEIPVIIFSSLGDREENVQKCKALGADDFIIKSQLSLHDISGRITEVAKRRGVL